MVVSQVNNKIKSNSLISILSILFVLSVFFPYIRIAPVGTDLQPNSLIIATILSLLLFKKHFHSLNNTLLLLSIPFLFSILIIAVTGFSMNSIRSLAGYYSVYIISLSTYLIYLNGYKLKLIFLYRIIAIWGVVGCLQHFFYKGLFSFAVARFAFFDSIGYGNRGVSSLSNEPSFYGSMCFFLWIVFITHEDYNLVSRRIKFIVLITLLVQTLLFASSTISLLFFVLLGLIVLLITSKKIIFFFFVLILFFSSQWISSSFLSIAEFSFGKNRTYHLVERIIESKSDLIYMDPSINERYHNVYISIKGSYENYFLPNGFDSFKEYKKTLMNNELSGKYWWTTDKHSRIQSGYGAVLFELGIIGCLIPLIFTFFLSRSIIYSRKKIIYLAIILNLVMFSSIPISMPVYSFLIGYFAYHSRGKRVSPL